MHNLRQWSFRRVNSGDGMSKVLISSQYLESAVSSQILNKKASHSQVQTDGKPFLLNSLLHFHEPRFNLAK